MRLYTFLLLAVFAIAARAATIPENIVTQPQKNIENVSNDKVFEEENIDQANIINDVDNQLRLKPADIPVQVVDENVNPGLKTNAEKDESQEIIREPIDLNNPGLPQHQEHNSQKPDAESGELSLVELYKKNIFEAQVILKNGFQDVSNGIQNIFEKKDQSNIIQHSIDSLRKGFVEQINKINGTVLSYLNNENGASPAEQQTKAQLEHLKTGLNNLKSEFTKGMNTLADGVIVFSSLKADEVTPAPGSSNPLSDFANTIQQQIMNIFSGLPGQQAGTDAPPPDAVQSDTEDSSTSSPSNPWFSWPFGGNQQNNNQETETGGFGSGNGPFVQAWNTFVQAFQTPAQTTESVKPEPATEDKPTEQSQSENKPEEESKPEAENKPEPEKPSDPAAATNQVEKTTLGPIREILQNNPIAQGIASVVQNLQNINNPQKPREPVKVSEVVKPATEDDKPKGVLLFPVPVGKPGHPPGAGDNIDLAFGLEQSEPQEEVQKETLPEVQEPEKQEEKEHKTEEVADKTE